MIDKENPQLFKLFDKLKKPNKYDYFLDRELISRYQKVKRRLRG